MKNLYRLLLSVGVLGVSAVVMAAAPTPITQADISLAPFVAQSNTRYVLVGPGAGAPLTLVGQPNQAVAIIIQNQENVEIDFDFNSLEVPFNGNLVFGIFVVDSKNITIKNGSVRGIDVAGGITYGVFAQGFNTLTVQDMLFENLSSSVTDDDSAYGQTVDNKNLTIECCTFNARAGAGQKGVTFGTLQDGTIQDSGFFNCANGVTVANNYKNIAVDRSSFVQCDESIELFSLNDPENHPFLFPSENALITDSQFFEVNRMLHLIGGKNTIVDHCTATAGDASKEALISAFTAPPVAAMNDKEFVNDNPQARGLHIRDCSFEAATGGDAQAHVYLGDTEAGSGVKDVHITHSTFTNRDVLGYFTCILGQQVQGLLIDHCIFDSVGYARDQDGCPLVINGKPVKSSNVQLGGCVDQGVADTQASDVTIRECILHGKSQIGIYSDTCPSGVMNSRLKIDNCSITAQEVGVLLNNTTSSNVVNSSIRDVKGTSFASGIGILVNDSTQCLPAGSSPANTICGNTVSNNQNGIVVRSASPNNLVVQNKAFANECCQICVGKNSSACENITCGCEGPCCLTSKICPLVGINGAARNTQKDSLWTQYRTKKQARAVQVPHVMPVIPSEAVKEKSAPQAHAAKKTVTQATQVVTHKSKPPKQTPVAQATKVVPKKPKAVTGKTVSQKTKK